MQHVYTYLFINTVVDHRYLNSYPTRRSSDLLTVKLSKYNVDDVALGVCKTGAEEAGVTEVRTSFFGTCFTDRLEERFSRNVESELVCRLLLEKKKDCSRVQQLDV